MFEVIPYQFAEEPISPRKASKVRVGEFVLVTANA